MMPGLVSVTFRQKTPLEICRLCERAELRAIEWGADVHALPHGRTLAEIRRMSRDHGLSVCSYGSYWRAGESLDELCACLDAACELGTGTVRIWGGRKGSEDAENERAALVETLIRAAEEARIRALSLALEYHGGTLTDSRQSVRRLIAETECVSDCLRFHWQPRFDWTREECLRSLEDVRFRLAHIHTFTWSIKNGRITRLPLASGEKLWKDVFSSSVGTACALLEFVENDCEEAFLRDAQTLRDWLKM